MATTGSVAANQTCIGLDAVVRTVQGTCAGDGHTALASVLIHETNIRMSENHLRTPDQQAVEAALARKGLTVLGEQNGALVVCRGLDSQQPDADHLDASGCQILECCILEVRTCLLF